jgi:hypothetical protein
MSNIRELLDEIESEIVDARQKLEEVVEILEKLEKALY